MFEFEDITPRAALELIKDQRCYLVDVRTPEEYYDGHIAGAHLLPKSEVQARCGELPRDPDRAIVVYCEHGMRSTAVCSLLAQHGWQRLLNMTGGASAWRECGLPVTSGPDNTSNVSLKPPAARP